MTIHEVAERTGLTKKAIKYYEREGLIQPDVNPQNHYRTYGEQEILRLNMIAALRALNVSVGDVKAIFEGSKDLADVLREILEAIGAKLTHLETSRLIVADMLRKGIDDPASLQAEVTRLRETLELSEEARSAYLADRLQGLFPGSVGKLLVLNFEPFLDVSLETGAQKVRWLELVAYLDELEEPPPDHPFLQLVQTDDEAFFNLALQNRREEVERLLSGVVQARDALRRDLVDMVRTLKGNEAFKEHYKNTLVHNLDLFQTIGVADDGLSAHLAALNEDYGRYLAIHQQIQEDVKRELGYGLKEI